MTPTGGKPVEPPQDHVGALIADWQAERPDLQVEPLAVVYRLLRLAGHLRTGIEKVFARAGISSADFAVLANLRRAGHPYQLTQRQLMESLRLTGGTISVRVDRLAERGVVRRDPDPQDGRGVLVTLTEHGERLFDSVAPEHLANEARLVAALDEDQQAQLARLLHTLLVEFEPTPAPNRQADRRLGLTVAPAHVTQQRRASVGLPPAVGLLVDHVHADGPAAAVDLRPGDMLVAADDLELRSLTNLEHAVAVAADKDGRIALRVRRAEQTFDMDILLQA